MTYDKDATTLRDEMEARGKENSKLRKAYKKLKKEKKDVEENLKKQQRENRKQVDVKRSCSILFGGNFFLRKLMRQSLSSKRN